MTETKDMTFNEIATIRNILVGKEMSDLEGDLIGLKEQLSVDLDEIRTAIDNVNKKIDLIRQQTEDRLTQLEQSLNTSDENIKTELTGVEQRNRKALSSAFLQLSNVFSEKQD